ncbi:MAG: type II toxin-antitoxin system RelE/ParE family toxin [Gemmatimonadaceae bacterium]|nr:type II toxin-antitoxin system RelE/ParE family toxin [Gloeobacterales cyanobacterium ES-bin-141]
MWEVKFHDDFEPEFDALLQEVQDELLACAKVLEEKGPTLGRPTVDTLNNSKYANMKEIRFDAADGVWRVAFAFDPERCAVLLVAGDKSGVSERFFYNKLIRKADKRFSAYLESLKQSKEIVDDGQHSKGKNGGSAKGTAGKDRSKGRRADR